MTASQLQQEIRQITEVIARNYQPERIVLFGSAARGSFRDGSDVDLMIIKDTSKKPLARVREVVDLLPHSMDVDILVLTPEEWQARKREQHYLIREIERTGQVVFQR